MQFTKKQKVAAVLGAGAVAVAGSGIAYAFYAASTSGSTDGTANVTQSTVGDVSPTAASTISGLVPGGSAVNSTVTLTNPNAYSVHIPAGKSVSVLSATGPAGCDTNAVAELSGTVAIPAQTILAHGTTTVSVPVSMADDPAVDQTSCNGGQFTVTYAVS